MSHIFSDEYLGAFGVLSADKRSQLTQLALLWSTASCANWMQVWRMCDAGELDSWETHGLAPSLTLTENRS
jgi:hypothetical protein